jgi:hypothetical protein
VAMREAHAHGGEARGLRARRQLDLPPDDN